MASGSDSMRIDFHSKVSEPFLYACRLVRKARAAGQSMTVYHNDIQALRRFSEMLWTFSQEDFLPHVMTGDALAAQTPVLLSHQDLEHTPHTGLLINLSELIPEHFSRFARMIEIVSTGEAETLAARERYRHYQQQGHQLSHHVAK